MWLVAKKSCDEFSAATVSLKASTIAVEKAEAVAEKLHKRIRLFQLLPKHSRQKSVLECQSSFILWSTGNFRFFLFFTQAAWSYTCAGIMHIYAVPISNLLWQLKAAWWKNKLAIRLYKNTSIDVDNWNSQTTPATVVFAQCEAVAKKAEDGRSEASDGILPFEWERAGGEMLGSKK